MVLSSREGLLSLQSVVPCTALLATCCGGGSHARLRVGHALWQPPALLLTLLRPAPASPPAEEGPMHVCEFGIYSGVDSYLRWCALVACCWPHVCFRLLHWCCRLLHWCCHLLHWCCRLLHFDPSSRQRTAASAGAGAPPRWAPILFHPAWRLRCNINAWLLMWWRSTATLSSSPCNLHSAC